MPLYELIPPGEPGTEQTLRRMTQLAAKDARNWNFIRIVSKIVGKCPARDHRCELDTILSFYRNFIRFQPDPLTALKGYVELVQAPFQTLHRRAGDCDDFSTLIAGTALALGLRPKFCIVKANPKLPNEWSHVYAAVKVNGQWLSVDPTVRDSVVGWEPRRVFARGEWVI